MFLFDSGSPQQPVPLPTLTMTTNTPFNNRSYSVKSIRNGLIAGYSAGICGIVVGHPLDSIKVLLQTNGGASPHSDSRSVSTINSATSTNPSKSNAGHADTAITRAAAQSAPANGSSNAAANVVQSGASKAKVSTAAVADASANQPARFSTNLVVGNRSIRALYAGVTGPLLTAGIMQSINFAIFDSVRRILYQRQLQCENPNGVIYDVQYDDYLHYDRISNIAISSFISGAAISIFTSPLVVVKTKQQIMVWGFREAIVNTYQGGMNRKPQFLKGLRNFYIGFGPHFFCDAFGRSVYFTSYEIFKRNLAQVKRSGHDSGVNDNCLSTHNISLSDRMFCAATAGMTCWIVIFPFDVIRSRLYAYSLTKQSSSATLSGFELSRQMIKEQGIKSLYRGILVTVARAGPVAAAVLPVYDSVLRWLSS